MQLRIRPAWLAVLGVLVAAGSAEAASTFSGLGDLPGGNTWSVAHAISDDGTTVVSGSESTSGDEAFRWTSATGMVGLGDLPGGAFQSVAYDVSSDGLSVVGDSAGANGDEAFRWRASDGMVGLGWLQSSPFFSVAKGIAFIGVSSDGVVGTSPCDHYAPAADCAFYWNDRSGSWVFVLPADAGGPSSYAEDISSTGVIVGIAHGPVSWQEAWRVELGGSGSSEFLGNLPGGFLYSQANSVSADGALIVGYAHSPGHLEEGDREAFLWSAITGRVGLGDLPGGRFFSEATAISADGTTVVGAGETDLGEEAFVLDQACGGSRTWWPSSDST